MKQHTVGFGAVTGLVIGVLVFLVGIHTTPDMLIKKAINAMQTPLIPVVGWVQGASHNWGSGNSGLYKLLLLIMGYWMLIGALIGFGFRLMRSRKVEHTF